MLYYTFRGMPVNKMLKKDILDCLSEGIEVLEGDGAPDCESRIVEQLRCELYIRELGL